MRALVSRCVIEWKVIGGVRGAEKWEVIRDGFVSTGESVLGWECRKQPDWFKESAPALEGLIKKRNLLFGRWLRSGRNSDRQRYVAQRRVVAGAVKKAKNEWLQEKARAVEVGMLSGGTGGGAWRCMREIQKGRAGMRPVMTRVIKKSSGEVCVGRDEALLRWQEHFGNVLNIRSSYLEDVINEVPDCPIDESLDAPPSDDEILEALGKMKSGKAGGKNGILPEMLKCCGANLLERLVELFGSVWREGAVPQEWKDALVVPIPKKGDLSLCDNWRGISLLDVGGKLFAKVVQQRLQSVAEKVLPETQCGFRSGRGCTDMIFCARQLMEKAIEHNTKLFLLFIDLKKAYDSVPREALWCVLRKYGVPPSMLNVVRSLHDGMLAEVTVDGRVAPEFEVRNGLRQGCVIAPTLFNLYFALVVEQWRTKCREFGVDVLYKCGGKLVGERTRKPLNIRVTELLFADDAVAIGTDRESMECAAAELERIIKAWGLTLSVVKTKLLVAGIPGTEEEMRPLVLEGGEIECVSDFKYLGSVLEAKGGVEKEVGERIAPRQQGLLEHSRSQSLGIPTCPIRPRGWCTEQWCWACFCMALRPGPPSVL